MLLCDLRLTILAIDWKACKEVQKNIPTWISSRNYASTLFPSHKYYIQGTVFPS